MVKHNDGVCQNKDFLIRQRDLSCVVHVVAMPLPASSRCRTNEHDVIFLRVLLERCLPERRPFMRQRATKNLRHLQRRTADIYERWPGVFSSNWYECKEHDAPGLGFARTKLLLKALSIQVRHLEADIPFKPVDNASSQSPRPVVRGIIE